MPALRAGRSMVRCRPAGQALIALPRCLRAAEPQPEREFLPGHALPAGDYQQGGLEFVDLYAGPGHQREGGGEVGGVHVVFAVFHH